MAGHTLTTSGDLRGRAGDRVNHGRLGLKGLYGWQGQSTTG